MKRRRASGFTLIELLLALFATALIMGAVLMIFQVQNDVTHAQTQVSEMQQSLRMAQHELVRSLRMAGRGGLPTSILPVLPGYSGRLLPAGMAISVQNNVPADTTIGGPGTPTVMPGTDILTIRGVISGSLYQVDPATSPLAGGAGTIQINTLSPAGVRQDLDPLAEAIDRLNNDTQPEALIVISPLAGDIYAILEMSAGSTLMGDDGLVQATVSVTGNGTYGSEYLPLMTGGVLPASITSASFIGVLEEYRYYVREDRAIPGDDASAVVPRLTRARFYPGTNVPHPTNPSADEAIVDGVLDLQIAFGVDQNNDGILTEGADEVARGADEWLLNDIDDLQDDPAVPGGWSWNSTLVTARPLTLLRITTLVRADRRQVSYISNAVTRIEDRDYNEPEMPADDAETNARSYRRQLIQSVIDLRNLG
jgi:type II secretory pathway pseudopilin PulG